MLNLCHATIVAPVPHRDSLKNLARLLGFRSVDTVQARGLKPGPIPIQFFLVDYRLGDDGLEPMLKSIRAHPDVNLRYAPIILMAQDGPVETFLGMLRLGFDDIIALPETRDMIAGRLSRQLRKEYLYIETADYLGPDRRRFDLPIEQTEQRLGIKPHSRLVIRREPRHGVRILRRHYVSGEGVDVQGPVRVAG